MNIKIIEGYITTCGPNWSPTWYIRSKHCIIFVLSGEARYISKDENVLLQQGHLYITPINIAYKIDKNPSIYFEEMWFHIEGIYNLPRKLIDLDTHTNIVIRNIVSVLISMKCSKVSFSVIEKQLETLFHLLPELNATSSQDERINSILNYIQNNYQKKLNHQIIANILNLNHIYVSRLFKSEMGITISKYIENFRIEKSCYFILIGHNIQTISQMVGYEDSKSFLRAFKRNIGMTISEFKRSII